MIHVNGIDVSDWSDEVDWDTVKADGYSFAYAKATESTKYPAATFAHNYDGMAAAGVLRGAYHMFDFGVDPTDQANYFLNYYTPASGDLPPAIDLELATTRGPRQSVMDIATFLAVVEKVIKTKMIIYVGYDFWQTSLAGTDAFSGHPLWLANYTDGEEPTAMPGVWSKMTIWQYSQNGKLDGVDAKVDLNRFIGTISDLRKIVIP